jgi:hypothetical protein
VSCELSAVSCQLLFRRQLREQHFDCLLELLVAASGLERRVVVDLVVGVQVLVLREVPGLVGVADLREAEPLLEAGEVVQRLAVGREPGLELLRRCGYDRRLLERGCVEEVRLVGVDPFGAVDVPAPVALPGKCMIMAAEGRPT